MKGDKVQKYNKRSLPWLLTKATELFNAFIRCRDAGQKCISCGNYSALQAGHFYSAGHYPALRYLEDNVHGQCEHCNYFVHGNLLEYRKNLIKKIGEERVKKLDDLAGYYKRKPFKWDRFDLINIILNYANK